MGKKGGGIRIKQVGNSNKAAKAMMTNPMEDLMIPPAEMVHLPPPPDRNYQIFWPIAQTFYMDHKDFIVIYPNYLDSTKSIKQGRRIGKDHAVDTPTVSDISQALQSLGLRHVLQPHKGYSRDSMTLWDNLGRVKVERPKIVAMEEEEDGTCAGSKRSLLLDIASRMPSLPSRIQRLEAQAKAEEEANTKRQEEMQKQQKQQQHQQHQSSSSNKKKGKKKRGIL